ncbi:MAG: putative thymidylate synthase [Prokaryotic dsDNA virus sp.]|nr:MAG: putative thymidylate synthase [Prokaryotic dsDNA virus sp.]|tara:strand:+ start:47557 stop:48540 length:984 start_codon:yes stop_codon:yes gene_type:complete
MIIKGKGGIEAECLLASASGYTDIPPIYTLRLRFPRQILAAFSKHTVLRFNGVSNRAVKTFKAIQEIKDNPYIPIDFGKQQKGMSGEYGYNPLITNGDSYEGYSLCLENDRGEHGLTPEEAWLEAMGWSLAYASAMSEAGIHQETVSRLLEPFQMTEIIVTATCWDNFFNLRLHKDAQGSFQELARVMKKCMEKATVRPLTNGWHLPMLTLDEADSYAPADSMRLSAARVCVISYSNHRGEPMDLERGLKLYNHLTSDPKALHLSPLEHQARPLTQSEYKNLKELEASVLSSDLSTSQKMRRVQQLQYHGSFKGWISNRYELEASQL